MAKQRFNDIPSLLEAIENVLRSFPTEAQKAQHSEALRRAAEFILQYQRALDLVPSQEQLRASGVFEGLAQVRLDAQSRPTTTRKSTPAVDMQKIQNLLARLQTAPEIEVRPLIHAAKLKKAELEEAVRMVGGTVAKGETKADLEEKLAKEVINRRTHAGLRGGAQPWQPMGA